MNEAATSWRRVRRPGWTVVWWSWSVIALYAGLVFATNHNHKLDALLVAVTAACMAFGLAMIVLPLVIALGADRFWPPRDVPPPPEYEPQIPFSTAYDRPPAPKYPLLAHAKGQCGWVQLSLRADRLGRIHSYAIAKQAPEGVFEQSVAAALFKTRLSPDPEGPTLRETTFITTFITPSKHAPDWAKQRLEENTSSEGSAPVGPDGAAL